MADRKRAPKARKAAGRRTRGPSFVAQVVADSDVLGTREAAKKHGLSARTVARYRTQALSGSDSALSASVAEKRAAMTDALRDETIDLLRVIGRRIGELVAKPDADLYKVVGAYKVLSDRVGTDELTKQMLDDDERDDAEGADPKPGALRVLKGGA